MIKSARLENFGPIDTLNVDRFGKLNVVIGRNGCGKTVLLKALYAMIRAREEWGRGDDRREFPDVLSDKFYWTFQVGKLGELVRKGAGNRLQAAITMTDGTVLDFDFGMDTSKKISPRHENLQHREENSVFLPPKEVLTLSQVILKSAVQDKTFGFDATYSDLVLALQNPKVRGRNDDALMPSRQMFEKMFQGKIEYDVHKEQWVYRQGNARFSINITAEGIKKVAILDTLLGNRFLSPKSVVFIDEPESALHPEAITRFLDIVHTLSMQGIQFFMATHSYYVVKKMHLLALEHGMSIPILVKDTSKPWVLADLKDGVPENEIINESIRLYDQEFEVSMR
jgi:AAA15 family ATPase/GTPase